MLFKKSNLSLYLFLLFLIFKVSSVFSQTGIAINNTGATADVSAMLDVASTNKGFLLPRLTTTQRDLINSPATGLVIFNSTLIAMQVNIGTPSVPVWSTLSAGVAGWGLTGNSGTNTTSNFLGTIDNNGLSIRTNSTQRIIVLPSGPVGIGVSAPTNPLVVKDTLEIARTGTLSELLFSNTAGSGDFRIGGDGGDIYWQGGGSRNLQMGAYWETIITGDRQTSTFPAFSAGSGGTGVLVLSARDASIPLGVQANSATQTGNLTEWRNSSGTALSIVNKNGYVGIGNTSPTAKLQVTGSGGVNPLILQSLPAGVNTDNLLTINTATGVVGSLAFSSFGGSSGGTSWLVAGNSGLTDNSNNYLGTNDNIAINFRYGGNKAGRIDAANTFLGSYSGYNNVNGSTLNTGMGYHALFTNTTGTRNTALGYGALQNNTGSDNVGVGYAAETNSTTNSIAIGRNSYITASYGIAIGDAAQTATNTYATAIGASAYATGSNSVSLGTSAQSAANYSLALGPNSYTSAPYSVALGQAAQTNTNNYAIAIGTNSYSSGVGSIAIGGAAAANRVQSQGTNSLSIGNSAYSGGTNAIAIGVSSNTTGSTSAIALGASSYGGGTNSIAAGTSASANGNFITAIGPSAVGNGTNSTALGYGATGNGNNSTAIGYNANAVNANTIVIGDAANTSLYTGLGIATPSYKLHVVAPSNPLFLAGVAAGGSSDSVLTILSGVVRKLPYSTFQASGTAWLLGGNSLSSIQKFGTISNHDLPFITNNTERMRINTNGDVAIGTTTFDPTNPEQLLVDGGTSTSVNVISGKGTIDSYLQLNIQNKSGGTSASSDVVATADNGDEFSNFVDMGINSSGNASGFFGNANDAYFYAAGNDFIIGNGTANKSLIFLTNGGSVASNERMRILSNGNIGIANTAPTQKLDVTGNIRFSGALMPNNLAGTSGYILTSTGAGTAPVWSTPSSVVGTVGWALGGNAVGSLQNFGTTTNYAVPVITNNVERMRIDVNGNVGIGTTSPSAALHVIKNSSGTNVITIQNTNTGGFSSMDFYSSAGALSSTFGFANSTSGGIFTNRAYMNSYNNDFVLTRNSGEYNIFIQGSSGNVGINNNAPIAKLDVTGNVKLGTNGTVFTNMIKTFVTADPPSVAANGQGSFTLAVTNAALNASVTVNPRATLNAGIIISHVYVSSANTVTVVLQNTNIPAIYGGAAIDLASQTWDVTVINP